MLLGSSVARTAKYLLLLASTPALWAPEIAEASWIESLVMPGEVVAKHARIERECDKCHESFNKEGQDRLCLDCHTDVAADFKQKRGHHGRAPSIRGRACKTCHTEHLGRQADIVPLDRKKFEHRFTDLPLRGGHERVDCDDCHAAGKLYREAPPTCNACHARKDPHEGSVGTACDDCHAETSWKEVRFDHDSTAFPLEGRHRDARCDGCHATKRYKPTSSACHACHQRDDKHRGRLGKACESCHTARAWSETRFDHARKTHFPLLGKHAHTPCKGCHENGVGPGSTPTTCRGCHQSDDAHRGRFGPRCGTCHTATEWRRHTFDHDRSTHYPLRGRHHGLKCTSCHRGDLYTERLDASCYACHRGDDVHHGQEGTRCDTCHDEQGWRTGVLFDHDLSRFPLLGAHVRVACADCHTSRTFKDVARECVSCHRKDDAHRGRLGVHCSECHNPASWKAWQFDHTARTRFRLDGAHAKIACQACHREPVTDGIELPHRCVSCHESDDVHRGQFGALCERCHETTDFRIILRAFP